MSAPLGTCRKICAPMGSERVRTEHAPRHPPHRHRAIVHSPTPVQPAPWDLGCPVTARPSNGAVHQFRTTASLRDLARANALSARSTQYGRASTGRRVEPIRMFSLPIGARVSRKMPSGADTEVRPPAALSLAPGGRCARLHAQRTGPTRSRFVLCPSGLCLPTNAQRSGHRGPPPRHPVSGPWRKVCSDERPADGGQADPGLFSAQRHKCLPTNPHRADTEVRAPAT